MSETVTIRGADGADYFYNLDRVLDGLVATLSAGRVDEAASLYAQVREDIAFQLIGKTQGNLDVLRQVANLFFRARDYGRAAYCCEQLDEHHKAAELYERADDHAQAAQMYALAGATEKAAEMYEKAGSLVEAARLHLLLPGVDHAVRAALCFERAHRAFDAAQAWEKAGKGEKALGLYHAVDDDSPDKKVAQKLAAALEEQLGMQRAQTGMMAAADIPVGGGFVDDAQQRVTMMSGFEQLAKLPLFSELALTELKAIYHLCELVELPFGAAIIEAGASSPALWVLLSGVLDVRGHSHDGAAAEIARLMPGAHVGEMGLFDDVPAGVDVVVSAPGRALRLDKRGFREVMNTNDAFAVRVHRVLFRTLRDRLRKTTDLLIEERA
jgi:tetratricopeptide (TPR) repeat protein